MSRIGIKPIALTDQLNLVLNDGRAVITGPRGELSVTVPHGISVTQKDSQIVVSRQSENKLYKSLHGTVRSLLQNAVTGVSTGFEKKCDIIGIGYRAAIEADDLVLQVGYTHPVRLAIPKSLNVKLEKNTVVIGGNDRQEVGQFAAIVRAVRPPDRYKGKGIRYQGEIIKLKPGKATKAGA